MENVENTVDTKRDRFAAMIGIFAFVLFVAFFGILAFSKDDDEPKYKLNEVEQKQVNSFNEAMEKVYAQAEGMEYDVAKDYIVDGIHDNADMYGGFENVDYLANQLLNEVLTSVQTTTDGLVKDVKNTTSSVTEELLNGLLGEIDENIEVRTISLKPETVCNDGRIDAKYCVNNLTAKVYVVDKYSDKWVVLLHGYMMNGSLMYRSVGEFYNAQGYNVLAPDLRGFGTSDGSVAMGYLESLDTYDWIKDLNNNYAQADRYGVVEKPATIVVHGVSLGGATTLQLATNPDIAAAKGGVYDKNLTQLNVKGFVDDCGYTSMSGIITGMLSVGDMINLTSVLDSLGIEKTDFMAEFNKVTSELEIPGFESFDASTLEDLDYEKINEYLEQFSDKFADLETEFKKYESSGGKYQIPGYDPEKIEDLFDEYASKLPTDYEIPTIEDIQGYLPSRTANTVSTTGDSSEMLDSVIGTVLMNLVGVGLTEENYAKYSDVFYEGRKFPTGAKVLIIHGTADTTVPHSFADIVEKNVSPGVLVHKGDVQGAPHAFIVVGMNKDKYSSVITKYTNCVTDNTCKSISE